MKQEYLLLLLSLIAVAGYGQDSGVSKKSMLLDEVKNKGVYRSYLEFQQNKPSYTDTFFIKVRLMERSRDILQTINTKGKRKRIRGYIWGFSDGYNVFVRTETYDPITTFGYICLHRGSFRVQTPGMMGADGTMTGGSSYLAEGDFFFDYTKGVPYRLKKLNVVTHVLSKDPELLEQFAAENKKKRLLKKYVLKFNERNTAMLLGVH